LRKITGGTLSAFSEGVTGESLQISVPLQWSDWRPGDQPVFVCGLDKARLLLKWQPTIPVREGVGRLIRWMYDNKQLFGWLN
jgi:CDP-paratose 2-epimerase